MSPTFEILKVVASDAYIADPTVIHEVAGILAKTPGCLAYVLTGVTGTPVMLTFIAASGTASNSKTQSISGSLSVSFPSPSCTPHSVILKRPYQGGRPLSTIKP